MNTFANLHEWVEKFPSLQAVINATPTLWLNENKKSVKPQLSLPLSLKDMEEGKSFMEKYAPFIATVFPETAVAKGHLTSPLLEIESFKTKRNLLSEQKVNGKFFLKCDSDLPVAGSIKARGGFFEVLHFAHSLAVKGGYIHNNEAADFNQPKLRELLSKYTIGVGSTGNLGMSIGIISAKLGFRVNVYMSHDAKEWKKNKLKENGANVIEESGDFGVAIDKGRRETLSNPYGYFVDDENSSRLFQGYSLAAFEIAQQLILQNITIDKEHPLFVYSPCGVGGSPGGVMFGLKMLFGDAVHSFFVEPTHAPCMLLGLITGKKEKVCVQDFGLDNLTEADGLAVGRPSAFASGIVKKLVSGIYTIEDKQLSILLKELYTSEKKFVEPSATAGLIGPETIIKSEYPKENKIDEKNITHIAWATGGSLVPENIKNKLLNS